MEDTTTTSSDAVQAAELESVVDPPIKSESAVTPTNAPVHPYLEEIMKCPNDWQLEKNDPIPCKSLEETPYTIVDTTKLLDEMLTKLGKEREIGVAVKGSKHRSFRKKNCLIQIANRSEVFLVDTIALKEDVKVLNQLFTNGGVLKVAHTKDGYLRDFQKDLGMYMVNVFCLPIAGKAINRVMNVGTSRGSNYTQLDVLLKEYCKVDYSQSLKELAKWHERPLTDEYLKCARVSVQYLLHIHDEVRNMLLDENLLKDVYKECNERCSTVWEPPKSLNSLTPNSHMSLYKRFGNEWKYNKEKQLSKVQMEVFRVLYDWRHNTAEKYDEGILYLMKDLAIYDIAKALPKDVEGIRNCLVPDIPCSLLEENMDHICELIVKSVDAMSGAADANTKVLYYPNHKFTSGGNKRRKVRKDMPQPFPKKNRLQQQSPFFSGRGAPRYGQPRYPINATMRPPMGFMRPHMGFMGPWSMRSSGMGMHIPPRPFGW